MTAGTLHNDACVGHIVLVEVYAYLSDDLSSYSFNVFMMDV